MIGVLKPANAIVQSQSVDICTTCRVAGASLESFKDIHKDDWRTELSQAPVGDDLHAPQRILREYLGEHIVISKVGHAAYDDPTITPCESLKKSLLDILERAT